MFLSCNNLTEFLTACILYFLCTAGFTVHNILPRFIFTLPSSLLRLNVTWPAPLIYIFARIMSHSQYNYLFYNFVCQIFALKSVSIPRETKLLQFVKFLMRHNFHSKIEKVIWVPRTVPLVFLCPVFYLHLFYQHVCCRKYPFQFNVPS